MKTIRKTLVLFSLWIQVLAASAFAQSNSWVPTGLYKQLPQVVVDKNNVVYAGGDGLYRSTDSGFNWADLSAKFPAQAISALGINSKNYVFACGTSSAAGGKILIDLYRSTDSGNSWQKVYPNLPDLIFAFAFNNSGHIFAAAASAGVLKSTNDGNSWQTVNTGLANASCLALAINSSGHIFAGTVNRGVYRSTDAGSNWQAINSGLLNYDVRAIVIRADGKIFAGTSGGGIFRSTDNGNTWVQVNYGLNIGLIVDLALGPTGEVYASSNDTGGIFRSVDHGNTWTQINRGLPAGSPYYYIASDQKNHLFAGTYLSGLYHRVEVTSTAPLPPQLVSPANGTVDAPSSPLLIWRKTPGAKSYSVGVNNVSYEPGSGVFGQFGISDTSIKATGMIVNRTYSWRVFAENEEGKSGWSESWQFTASYDNVPPTLVWPPNNATNISPAPTLRWNTFPNATGYCVVVSTSPTPYASVAYISEKCVSKDTSHQVIGLASNSTYYWWVQTSYPNNSESKLTAIYRFTTGSAEPSRAWVPQKSATNRRLNALRFVDKNRGWAVGDSGLILHTRNGGSNWNQQKSPVLTPLNDINFFDQQTGIVIGDAGTILRTTDGGVTWSKKDFGFLENLTSLSFSNGDTGAILGVKNVFQSFDKGDNWKAREFDVTRLTSFYFLNARYAWAMGLIYFIGGHGEPLGAFFRTNDGGQNWMRTSSGAGVPITDPYFTTDLYFSDTFQGWLVTEAFRNPRFGNPGVGAICHTTDSGTTWESQYSRSGITFRSIHFTSPQVGTAVGDAGIIFNTTDGGKHWNFQASGTTNDLRAVFFTDTQNGWVVGQNGTILHTTTGGITAIEENLTNEPPQMFELKQNYPNPFNPNTTIEFSLPEASHVTLKIFNLRGEEVETLTAREYLPGTYKLEWAAKSLASGVYFYRLQAGDFVAARKMALLR